MCVLIKPRKKKNPYLSEMSAPPQLIRLDVLKHRLAYAKYIYVHTYSQSLKKR